MTSSQLLTPEVKVFTVGKEVQKKELDYSAFVRRSARENDFSTLIKHSLIIKDENERPVIVYLEVPDMPSVQMVKILKGIRYGLNRRTRGVATRSRIFGYMPRETMRKDFCSSTTLARDNPEDHDFICRFGTLLTKFYEKYCPDTFKMHMDVSEKRVLKNWRIPDTPFTSGIINKNNPLKYHFDAGNITNVYSNMVCFKKDCTGGYLALPEYDIGLEIADKSILLFDGQAIVHGVTPFKMTTINGYRYTLVYYTLKKMWKCQPIDEELARVKQVRLERELRRYKRLTGELKPEEDPLVQSWNRKREKLQLRERQKQQQQQQQQNQV